MASSKANSRQHGVNMNHYRSQYMQTYKNKAKRVKRSNGEAFFKTWDAVAKPNAQAMAASRPRPTA